MPSEINALEIRRRLGRDTWGIPREYGPGGWIFDHLGRLSSIIVSAGIWEGVTWIHASISHADHTPSYDELVHLHKAVWMDRGWAYQVFAPVADHVNIHNFALHLWGRLDGQRPASVPNFGQYGTI